MLTTPAQPSPAQPSPAHPTPPTTHHHPICPPTLQNLGDEGFAYVVDALSFNDRCAAADFSKNGIGAAGVGQLCQALQVGVGWGVGQAAPAAWGCCRGCTWGPKGGCRESAGVGPLCQALQGEGETIG